MITRKDKENDTNTPSLFIDHLTQNLTRVAELGNDNRTEGDGGKKREEIRTTFTRTMADVKREMDEKIPGWDDNNDDRMPYMISMLTRDLYFPTV